MKRISTEVGTTSIEDADALAAKIDRAIRKGGTISMVVVRQALLDDEGNLVSSYPHPETNAPIPLLVDRMISTEFALRS